MNEMLVGLKQVAAARGFDHPPEFLRAVSFGLMKLEPWWVLSGEEVRESEEGLRKRYPDRSLWPFARRQDNDDVACWIIGQAGVVVIHDFASAGWEGRNEFDGFNAWLVQAINDFIEWGDEEIDYYRSAGEPFPWN